MALGRTNNAVTFLPAGLSSTATTLTVTTGTGVKFPPLGTGDTFFLTISDIFNNFEIVKVTARVDDVMTIVRAQAGTLPLPFPPNSRVELRVTAENIGATLLL